MQLKRTAVYERSEKKALKKYPLSERAIKTLVNNMVNHPEKGDVYPGLNEARKVRLPLAEYKIGTQGGMRLIYLVGKRFLLPIMLYFKKQYKEEDVKGIAILNMKRIQQELAQERTEPITQPEELQPAQQDVEQAPEDQLDIIADPVPLPQ